MGALQNLQDFISSSQRRLDRLERQPASGGFVAPVTPDTLWADDHFVLNGVSPKTVTLTYTPVNDSIDVKHNGLAQLPGTDWTRSGRSLTFTEENGYGDELTAHYQYLSGQTPTTPPVGTPSLITSGATIGKVNFPTAFPTAQAGDVIIIGLDRGQISDPQINQIGPEQQTGQSEYDYYLRVYAGYIATDGGSITGFNDTATGDMSWAIYRNATIGEIAIARSDVNAVPLSLTPPEGGRVAAVYNAYGGGVTGTPGNPVPSGWTSLSTYSYTFGRSSQNTAVDPVPPYTLTATGLSGWQVVLIGLEYTP